MTAEVSDAEVLHYYMYRVQNDEALSPETIAVAASAREVGAMFRLMMAVKQRLLIACPAGPGLLARKPEHGEHSRGTLAS